MAGTFVMPSDERKEKKSGEAKRNISIHPKPRNRKTVARRKAQQIKNRNARAEIYRDNRMTAVEFHMRLSAISRGSH